jgi:hypothetical protein
VPKDKPASFEIVDCELSAGSEKIANEEFAILKEYLPDLIKKVLMLVDQDEE